MQGSSSSSSSKVVIMGATVAMLITLGTVLALVLILLAELYCSLLLRKRRRRHHPANTPPPSAATPSHDLCSFYAQLGVIRAPRSFLFPAPQHLDLEKQEQASPNHSSPTSSSEQLMYIRNPIYSNDDDNDDDELAIRIMMMDSPPFETPATSPSHLELEAADGGSPPTTPPLTPMKKLPPQGQAPSVSLGDADRSICTTTATNDSNCAISSSSSSSSAVSPSTSPSW